MWNPSEQRDTDLEIARGNIPGLSPVRKFGRNDDVDNANSEDIFITGGDQPYLTSADTFDVVSTSTNDTLLGTGARTLVVEGLDSNYMVQSETINMDGDTPVTTTKSYLRLYRAYVDTAGSVGTNDGTITFDPTSGGNTCLTIGLDNEDEGDGQTFTAQYTIPAGKTAYLKMLKIGCAASPGQTGVKEAHVSFIMRELGKAWRKQAMFSCRSDGTGSSPNLAHDIPQSFPEKTDLRFRANVDNNNTAVHVRYTLVLIDN